MVEAVLEDLVLVDRLQAGLVPVVPQEAGQAALEAVLVDPVLAGRDLVGRDLAAP